MFLNVGKFNDQPILVAFNVGAFARKLESQTDAEIVEHALSVLRKIFTERIPHPVGAKVTRWGSDPFALGAYSYIPHGEKSESLDILGEPVGDRLFFAGEATSSKDYATVHAAYLSGVRAAKQIKSV
jgi:monoamine oxidase